MRGEDLATTVKNAFKEFMCDKVNLDQERTKIAKRSRDNLIEKINSLECNEDFFNLYTDIHISFGSFARKTKIRPLDDIDIMVGIRADGSTYYDYGSEVKVYIQNDDTFQKGCCNEDSNILNSTKVINKFINEIERFNDYKNAEIHKDGSAATIQLKSYEWNFDIVPCFLTAEDSNGISYYLIPNGKGNWLKTDPRKDREKVTDLNKRHSSLMLETIRLVKYWNKRPTMPLIPSYVLECLLLEYFDSSESLSNYIDVRFKDILLYIKDNIWNPINDPKEIQDDLNTLGHSEKTKIANKSSVDYNKANEAISAETEDQEKAINRWAEIFGSEFPEYCGG